MNASETIVQSFCKYFHGRNEATKNVEVGAEGPAVLNLTHTLHALGLPVRWDDKFNDHVSEAVEEFQTRVKHQNVDGIVGPGTRKKLVLAVIDPAATRATHSAISGARRLVLRHVEPTWETGFYSAFLSLWRRPDRNMVDDIQACLEQNGVRAIRGTCRHSRTPGRIEGQNPEQY